MQARHCHKHKQLAYQKPSVASEISGHHQHHHHHHHKVSWKHDCHRVPCTDHADRHGRKDGLRRPQGTGSHLPLVDPSHRVQNNININTIAFSRYMAEAYSYAVLLYSMRGGTGISVLGKSLSLHCPSHHFPTLCIHHIIVTFGGLESTAFVIIEAFL
jgi:hypothetical protein